MGCDDIRTARKRSFFLPKQVRFGVLSSGKRWAAVAGCLGRGNGPGLPLGCVRVSFLGSWSDGSRWAPFMFPSFWVLGRMGGPRQRSWASIGLPSGFLSGLLGGMGKPRPRSWAPVELPSCFLLFGLLGRMGGPRPLSWARIGLPSYCLSGLLGRMGGPQPRSCAPVGLPSCFLLCGGSHWAPFIFPFFMFPSFWVQGRMGGPRQRSGAPIIFPFWALGLMRWAPVRLLSCLLSGRAGAGLPFSSLHWGGPRWAPFILPFWVAGLDGWAAANELGSH